MESIISGNNMKTNNLWASYAAAYKNYNVSMERLASGKRINSAADDAVGLSISERMLAQHNGYLQGNRNIQEGVSMIQTADASLSNLMDLAQNTRGLLVEAASETISSEDRARIVGQIDDNIKSWNDIVKNTVFNGHNLLNGDAVRGLNVHVGPDADDNISVRFADMRSLENGFSNSNGNDASTVVPIRTAADAANAIEDADHMIDYISNVRSELGGFQKRLENTMKHNDAMATHVGSARDRIVDVDVAKELTSLVKSQMQMNISASLAATRHNDMKHMFSLLFQ